MFRHQKATLYTRRAIVYNMDMEHDKALSAAHHKPATAGDQGVPDISLDHLLSIGIFNATRYPYRTRPHKSTPANMASAIRDYATTPVSWPDCTDKHGIDEGQGYKWMERYPEIRAAFLHARANKAHVVAEAAHEQYKHAERPPEYAYFDDRNGSRRVDPGWVSYQRDRSNALARAAAYYETGSAVQQRKVDQQVKSTNLNLNIKADAGTVDLANGLDGLLSPPGTD